MTAEIDINLLYLLRAYLNCLKHLINYTMNRLSNVSLKKKSTSIVLQMLQKTKDSVLKYIELLQFYF